MVKSPVPTVIETGLGTNCRVTTGSADADGEAEKATRYPATAARRGTNRRVLRRRLGIADLSAPEQADLHCYPGAVRSPTNLGLHPCAQRPQGRRQALSRVAASNAARRSAKA